MFKFSQQKSPKQNVSQNMAVNQLLIFPQSSDMTSAWIGLAWPLAGLGEATDEWVLGWSRYLRYDKGRAD